MGTDYQGCCIALAVSLGLLACQPTQSVPHEAECMTPDVSPPSDPEYRFQLLTMDDKGPSHGGYLADSVSRAYSRIGDAASGRFAVSDTGIRITGDADRFPMIDTVAFRHDSTASVPTLGFASIASLAKVLVSDSLPFPLFIRGCAPVGRDSGWNKEIDWVVDYRADGDSISIRIENKPILVEVKWYFVYGRTTGLRRMKHTQRGLGTFLYREMNRL